MKWGRGVDDVDALVAAPDRHALLLENEHVRVLDTHIAAGEATPVHMHRWPAVRYVLVRDALCAPRRARNVLVDSRGGEGLGAGASWTAPFPPHTLENVGDSPMHVLAIELKQA